MYVRSNEIGAKKCLWDWCLIFKKEFGFYYETIQSNLSIIRGRTIIVVRKENEELTHFVLLNEFTGKFLPALLQ